MKAADWTYEKLVECTAQELEQLIANLETAQNRAKKRCAATTAAIKRARTVLYTCGILLPQAAKPSKLHPITGEEIVFAAKHTLNKQQLLATVHLMRLIAGDAAKHAADKQRLLEALAVAADAKKVNKAVFALYQSAQEQAANSTALLEAA